MSPKDIPLLVIGALDTCNVYNEIYFKIIAVLLVSNFIYIRILQRRKEEWAKKRDIAQIDLYQIPAR